MRRASELIGKPIIVAGTNERCAFVSDLIVDQRAGRLLGFTVDDGGSRGTRVVPFERVAGFAEAGLYVRARSDLVAAGRLRDIRRVIRRRTALHGTPVADAGGHNLGVLLDVCFDETNGRLTGFLVSGGDLAGLYLGRSDATAAEEADVDAIAPAAEPVAATDRQRQRHRTETSEDIQVEYTKLFGNDKQVHWDIVAPDGTLLAHQGQPVTQELAEQAARYGMLGELYWAVGGRAVGEPDLPAAPEPEDAEGLTARRTVRASRGLLIVAEGQVVTQPIIARARLYRKEEELLEAVGLLQLAAVPQPDAEEDLETVVRRARIRLRGAWSSFAALLGRLRRSGRQALQEAQARKAIGRRVASPIYAADNQLLLDDGGVVTAEIVAHARKVGALDRLLDSLADEAARPESLTLEEQGLDEDQAQDRLAEHSGAAGRPRIG